MLRVDLLVLAATLPLTNVVARESSGCLGDRKSDLTAIEVAETLKLEYSPDAPATALAEPRAVVAPDNGLIYLGDAGSMSIKVYDTQGQFVDQFGGRGRGRAQLLSIQSMALDGEAIVVADAYRRAFTWWSLDGTFKRELVLDHEVGWPTQFSRLADGRWLLLYLAPPFFHGPLLHIRSRDLSVAEEVVSELKGLVDADAASLFVHASRPGRFALLDGGGTIAYVPGPYEGRVHFFRRSQSGFDHGVLRGYTPQIKPIQDLDASGDHKFVRSFHAGPSTGGERAYALSHETLALRFFSGGTMVHLFRADTPGYEAVLFQVFSPREGKHFGVREIRSLSHEMTTLGWHHEFLGWSSAGSLFVWHYADGAYPVVRAFQFSCLQ